jgi:hypothetical protein
VDARLDLHASFLGRLHRESKAILGRKNNVVFHIDPEQAFHSSESRRSGPMWNSKAVTSTSSYRRARTGDYPSSCRAAPAEEAAHLQLETAFVIAGHLTPVGHDSARWPGRSGAGRTL